MQRHTLQKLSREELIREAERAGVPRPRVLTQTELVDEILKRTATSDPDRARARGWLGRARDLLATVVEKGLHLPDAAAAIRTGPKGWPPPPPPLPTVTLAEIYAAQGHLDRAVVVLEDVLRREPDHQEARELRERFLAQIARGPRGASEPPARPAAEAESDEAEAGEAAAESAASEEEQRAASEEEQRAAPVSAPPTLPASPEAVSAAPAQSAPVEQERSVIEDTLTVDSDGSRDSGPELVFEGNGVVSVAQLTARSPSTRPAAASSEEPASVEPPAALASDAVVLPEQYDVDEVVALAVDPSTFYVYWEVRPTTFAHMSAQGVGGSLALRVMAVTPGWDGPIVETRDVRVDALSGDQFIHHVRPRADVRVSIGWLRDGQFDPIAVGAEVAAPRAFVAAGSSTPGGAPMDLSEGPHGSLRTSDLGGFARAGGFAARVRERGMERLAAGWVPRELLGPTLEGGASFAGGAAGPTGWIWVPGSTTPGTGGEPGGMYVTYGPASGTVAGPGGASEMSARPWGGASEIAGRWGGASELSAS